MRLIDANEKEMEEGGRRMNNAEKFKQVFGLYATELWSMPESDFLAWLNRTAETAQNVQNEDLIYRKAAIDALHAEIVKKRIANDTNDGMLDEFDTESVLRKLPSAQSKRDKSDWIPCSEKLPEDLTEVNVTYVNHDPEPYYASIKDRPLTGSTVYYEDEWYWYSSTCVDYLNEYGKNDSDKVDDAIEITAWMPFPAPYQGGKINEID